MARSKAGKAHKVDPRRDESINRVDGGPAVHILAGMQRKLEITSTVNRLVDLLDDEPLVSENIRNTVKSLQLIIQTSLCSDEPLPTEAPERWLDRENRDELPVDFIRRVYKPWLGKGLSRPDIRQLDYSLYQAFYGWLAKGNKVADDFHLPTRREANDVRYANLELAGEEMTRRLSALKKDAARMNKTVKRRARRLAR